MTEASPFGQREPFSPCLQRYPSYHATPVSVETHRVLSDDSNKFVISPEGKPDDGVKCAQRDFSLISGNCPNDMAYVERKKSTNAVNHLRHLGFCKRAPFSIRFICIK